MVYNLSKCILVITRFLNKNVFPHSLGPDIIHLKFSGNIALTIILSLASHDCRLPLTLKEKLLVYGTMSLVSHLLWVIGETGFALGHPTASRIGFTLGCFSQKTYINLLMSSSLSLSLPFLLSILLSSAKQVP